MTTFRHEHVFNRAYEGCEIRIRAPWRRASEAAPYRNGASDLDLLTTIRVLFGIAGVLAGAYACSSSASAEIEENVNQEVGKSRYSISALSHNAVTNLSDNEINLDDVDKYLSPDNSRDIAESVLREVGAYTGAHPVFASSNGLNGFDDAFIPETVWSLDANTGVHLDRVSYGSDSAIYAVVGRRRESTDFWLRAIFGSSRGNDSEGASSLPFAPLQLQVGSCGGSSPERGDLDYCEVSNNVASQVKNNNEQKSDNNSSEQGNTSEQSNTLEQDNTSQQPSAQIDNINLSNVASSLNLNLKTIYAAGSASVDNFQLEGSLVLLSPCGVTSASCMTIEIDPPSETSIESPPNSPTPAVDPMSGASSNDGLTSPLDLLPPEAPPPIPYLDDPAPVSDLPPVFTPQPLKPIPEAPTWVMTLLGFGAMIFVFRKRRLRMNPISIIDVS
jgi:hypothetical protein